jgi:AcrR family transcriptional regulator
METMTRQATVAPAGDARERILRAAEKLFGEKGFAATSVQEITEAAEVNKALLYYYFEDKQSVYASLIDKAIAGFHKMLTEALETPGSHADRLRAFVRGELELLAEHRETVRVIYRCLLSGEQEAVGLTAKFEQSARRLEDFFREAADSGEFRCVDPSMAALSLLGMVDKFACAEIHHRKGFDPEAVVAHISDLLLHGLRAE